MSLNLDSDDSILGQMTLSLEVSSNPSILISEQAIQCYERNFASFNSKMYSWFVLGVGVTIKRYLR